MNVAKMLQQAQRAQAELQKALGELEVEGSAGGGLVRVRLNGLKDLRGIAIDPAAAAEDAGMLADLVTAAWEEAARQLEEASREVMRRHGLPPGLGNLL